ncbi:hypothetical protein GCM10009534_27550 [Kribbella sandramycini]
MRSPPDADHTNAELLCLGHRERHRLIGTQLPEAMVGVQNRNGAEVDHKLSALGGADRPTTKAFDVHRHQQRPVRRRPPSISLDQPFSQPQRRAPTNPRGLEHLRDKLGQPPTVDSTMISHYPSSVSRGS